MPCRDDQERARVIRFERLDVIIALGLVCLVNLAMLAVAAKLLHTPALSGLSTIEQAHAEFGHLVGGSAALAFAVAVFASGIDPTNALVLSQVVLSFGIPLALIPLVVMTGRRDVMGAHVNRPITT